jgi:hypothetical protein
MLFVLTYQVWKAGMRSGQDLTVHQLRLLGWHPRAMFSIRKNWVAAQISAVCEVGALRSQEGVLFRSTMACVRAVLLKVPFRCT